MASTQQKEYAATSANLLPPGSVITLAEPPLTVNISISDPIKEITNNTTDRLAHTLTQCSNVLHQLSMTDNNIVLPLKVNSSQFKTQKGQKYTIPGQKFKYKLSRVTITDLFPYNIALAMTVHKAQGCTIKAVILALSCHPTRFQQMKFASIYVAMS